MTKESPAGRDPANGTSTASSFEATDAATNDLTASAAAMFANAGRTTPTFVDQKRVDPDAPGNAEPQHDRAINALRAATTAAGTHVRQPSAEDIEQVRDLHAMTVEAERRSRRVVSKPGARRRYQYAFAAETASLQLLGFATYDEFVAVHGATSGTDEAESDETITRIRALLTELGVDPLGDPLRAASDFLSAHESELVEGGIDAVRQRGQAGTMFASAMPSAPETTAPSTRVEPEPALVEPKVIEPMHIVEPADVEPAAVETSPTPEAALAETPTTETAVSRPVVAEPKAPESPAGESEASEPVAADPIVSPPVVPRPGVSRPTASRPPTSRPAVESGLFEAVTPKAPPEPEAPWVPAAHIPSPAPAAEAPPEPEAEAQAPQAKAPAPEAQAPQAPDEDVVDRWIHAEARAERMHAEVDRAQAELVAMLARSADLEQTVVTRVDELDLVNAELESVQQRVEELERSIAESDAERAEIERALATSRARVGELEAMLAEREAARAVADQQREAALDTVAGLEATLAARASELEQARLAVSDLEAQLVAQAAHLEEAREETGTVRAASDALIAELEATKRSLDALDSHAEAIEAELAEARRTAGSPEVVRELEAVRQELTEARHELGHLEVQRAETDRLLALDRIELQQLQHTLATTRDQAIDALDELTDVRRSVEETRTQAEAAERVREAVTIDAADLLARAEAEATTLIDRANRDAEAIRQEAMYANGIPIDFNRAGDASGSDDATMRALADHVERLERKVAKQRRRLDRLSADTTRDSRAKAKLKPGDFRKERREHDDAGAAAVLASAEREAAEIRRAARRDRERFREELVGLLTRLAPLASEGLADDDDDFEDD